MTNQENNTWPEYRRLLLDFCEETKIRLDKGEIKDDKLDEAISVLRTEIHQIEIRQTQDINLSKIDIASIKTKIGVVSAVVGFVAGLVPIIIQIIWYFLSRIAQ